MAFSFSLFTALELLFYPDYLLGSTMQGLGVVCNKEEGFSQDDFVVEFLGEVSHHICLCNFTHAASFLII